MRSLLAIGRLYIQHQDNQKYASGYNLSACCPLTNATFSRALQLVQYKSLWGVPVRLKHSQVIKLFISVSISISIYVQQVAIPSPAQQGVSKKANPFLHLSAISQRCKCKRGIFKTQSPQIRSQQIDL